MRRFSDILSVIIHAWQYTLCPKKTCDYISTITLTIGIRLQ